MENIEDVLQRIEALEGEMERITSTIEKIQERMDRLEVEMRKREGEIESLEKKLRGFVEGVGAELSDVRGALKELKRELILKKAKEGVKE